MSQDLSAVAGTVFDLDQTAIHDGPGARMNVYFKGCPMRCDWCHSPESQDPWPEIVWYETRCRRCGRCIEVCPSGRRGPDGRAPDGADPCTLCGKCVQVCENGALAICGREATAGEIVAEARKLKPFFRRTGGGVTLTGGEPTAQPDFAFAVAALCKDGSIHVAIETCGSASWSVFEKLLPVVDLFLYDVKHVDGDKHRKHTGAANDGILDNLRRLVSAGGDVVVRVALIPGFNDEESAISRIAGSLARIGVLRMSLLPFNTATEGKYSWVGREAPWRNTRRQSRDAVDRLRAAVEDVGIEVVPA